MSPCRCSSSECLLLSRGQVRRRNHMSVERKPYTFYPPLIGSLLTALEATVAGWRRFYRTGIIVSFLLAGCTSWNQLMPIPPELTEAGVQARLRIHEDPNVNPADTMV